MMVSFGTGNTPRGSSPRRHQARHGTGFMPVLHKFNFSRTFSLRNGSARIFGFSNATHCIRDYDCSQRVSNFDLPYFIAIFLISGLSVDSEYYPSNRVKCIFSIYRFGIDINIVISFADEISTIVN